MIRLQRVGRRNDPSFRLVVTDSRNSTKSGKFLEIVGSYDPRHKANMKMDKERILYWISKGAQPSDTIHNILIKNSVISGKTIDVSNKPRKTAPTDVGVAKAV